MSNRQQSGASPWSVATPPPDLSSHGRAWRAPSTSTNSVIGHAGTMFHPGQRVPMQQQQQVNHNVLPRHRLQQQRQAPRLQAQPRGTVYHLTQDDQVQDVERRLHPPYPQQLELPMDDRQRRRATNQPPHVVHTPAQEWMLALRDHPVRMPPQAGTYRLGERPLRRPSPPPPAYEPRGTSCKTPFNLPR